MHSQLDDHEERSSRSSIWHALFRGAAGGGRTEPAPHALVSQASFDGGEGGTPRGLGPAPVRSLVAKMSRVKKIARCIPSEFACF